MEEIPLSLDDISDIVPVDEDDKTTFNVNAVNLEENGGRSPIPYVLPLDIERQQVYGGTQIIQQNEQSMSLEICDIEDGDAALYSETSTLTCGCTNACACLFMQKQRASSKI